MSEIALRLRSVEVPLFGDVQALLTALRKRSGLSRAKVVARAVGVSSSALAGYESGENSPGVDAFEALLAAYEIETLEQLAAQIRRLRGEGELPTERPKTRADLRRRMAEINAEIGSLMGELEVLEELERKGLGSVRN